MEGKTCYFSQTVLGCSYCKKLQVMGSYLTLCYKTGVQNSCILSMAHSIIYENSNTMLFHFNGTARFKKM
jgi:hypothetical protein